MDNTDKNEYFFEAVLKAAFSQYIEDTCATYPTKEELANMYPVPKRGLKRIKREIRRRKRAQKRSPLRTVGIVSVILASLLAAGALLMLIPAVRNTVTEFTQDLLGVKIVLNSDRNNDRTPPHSDDTSVENELIYDYEITYIPDGYTQREYSLSQNRGYYSYFDEDGRYIYVSISPAHTTSVSLDGDSFEHESIDINGRQCHLAYNPDNGYGTAIISDGDFVVQIDAIAERQEILKIAEGILTSPPDKNSGNAPPLNLY